MCVRRLLPFMLAAGCTVSDRYLVDGERLGQLDRWRPGVERIGDHRRRVGDATVEVACAGPPARCDAVVTSGRRQWEGRLDGPAGDCRDSALLDEMAAQAERRFRFGRSAIAATRERDGAEVQLRLDAIDFATVEPRGDGDVAVVARGRPSLFEAGAIVAGVGAALTIVGGVLLGAAQTSPSCDGASACVLDGFYGAMFVTAGGIALVAGGLLALFGLGQHPQEAPANSRALLYFE